MTRTPRGVLGTGGAGIVDHFGLHERVDIQVGTLSKAIGVLGGFIAGPTHLIEWLQNRGRPYPLDERPAARRRRLHGARRDRRRAERLARLWSNTEPLQGGVARPGVRDGRERDADHAGDHARRERTQAFAVRLFEEGVFCPAIVFPTVGKGLARVRTIVTADHTEVDLREALEVFARVGSELGLR